MPGIGRWLQHGQRGSKDVVAVAAGICAIAGAIAVVEHVVGSGASPATAAFKHASVRPSVPWDSFVAANTVVKTAGPPSGSIVLLAQVGTTKPGNTGTGQTDTNPTDTNPTDTNPTDTNPTDTNPTDTNPTDTNPTDTNPTDTQSTETTVAPAVPAAAQDGFPLPDDHASAAPPSLTEPQRTTITHLAKRVRLRRHVPSGCERSLTSATCPAAVDLGALPGPAGSRRGTLERYPYVDQARVIEFLLRTLPKVRYRLHDRRRVPYGVVATVRIAATGDPHRKIDLYWSVLDRHRHTSVAWETSRIADTITWRGPPHLLEFWVPMPAQKGEYALRLVVAVRGEDHAADSRTVRFR